MKLATPKFVLLSLLAAASVSPIVGTSPDEDNTETRIVGGTPADSGEYPYYVQMNGCGGALVAPDVVLTAAHCRSRVGQQWNIGAVEAWTTKGGAEGRFCETFVYDDNYRENVSPANYDFALCKLNEPIYVDESKVKLELNFDGTIPKNNDELKVMGFGVTKFPSQAMVDDIREVSVNYISTNDCNSNTAYGGLITQYMLCAGIKNVGKKDACSGDSGGPIVRRTKRDGVWIDTHVGVVSWGAGCGLASKPGVYSRTSSRANWIKDTICGEKFKSVATYCNNKPPPKCDKAEVTFKLKTDDKPDQISWILYDKSNNAFQQRNNFRVERYQNEETLCLNENESYRWVIMDRGGDGICSGGCGSYSVEQNGKTLASGTTSFGSSKTLTISTEEAAKAPLPTPMTDPNCKDNPKFRRKGQNCTVYLNRGRAGKRCKQVIKGQSIKNFWCRKTCAEKMEREFGCFPLVVKKKKRRSKKRNVFNRTN